MCHPAYPSAADSARETAAVARDVADLAALSALRRIVTDAITRAGRVDRIHHPDRRWGGAPELIETLQGELLNIDGEADRIRRSPLVLEDA